MDYFAALAMTMVHKATIRPKFEPARLQMAHARYCRAA
jgi:hypothetical protein